MSDIPRDDGHVGDLVSAHLDGELDAETTAWVRDHLDGCAGCRALAADTETARMWVRSLPEVDGTPVVEHLLARHRNAIRAGAAFVGLAAVVVGSLALTAAVIRTDVVPDIDAMVHAHRATTAGQGWSETGGETDDMAGIDGMSAVKHVGRVGSPYSAPRDMDGASSKLSRQALYDGDDLTVVVYDNGGSIVSVFQQPGRADWDRMPPGTMVTNGHREAWVPARAREDVWEPMVMVSEIGDIVVTVVSEDPGAAIAVIEQLPDGHRDSAWDRVHDTCSRFTEVFSLRG